MMRNKQFFSFCVFIAVISFFGCPVEPDETPVEDQGNLDSPIQVVPEKPRYYSFSTGQEVSNPAGTDWDIAFTYDRLIYTNSGDTATTLGSNGQGGVWFTGQTNFDGVVSATGADFSGDYTEDKAVYTQAAAEMGAPILTRLNVISYAGYGSGSGTETDPFTDYRYNRFQYYIADLSDMPPTYTLTSRVYIIRHANGVDYSKLQIGYFQSINSTSGNRRIYQIKYQKF